MPRFVPPLYNVRRFGLQRLEHKHSECLSALRRYKGLGAAPVGLFVEAFLHFKQTVVAVGVGHQLALGVTVDVFLLDQEPDEILFLDLKLLRGLPEDNRRSF